MANIVIKQPVFDFAFFTLGGVASLMGNYPLPCRDFQFNTPRWLPNLLRCIRGQVPVNGFPIRSRHYKNSVALPVTLLVPGRFRDELPDVLMR